MKHILTFVIGIMIGIILGAFFQHKYDKGHLNVVERIQYISHTSVKTDTLQLTDTIERIKPIPKTIYTTVETVYIQNKPIERIKTRKTYNDTIERIKRLSDTLNYAQRIIYDIRATDDNIDTIGIHTEERIPIQTKTITIRETICRKSRISVGVGIGVGITTNGTVRPYLGISAIYPIWER